MSNQKDNKKTNQKKQDSSPSMKPNVSWIYIALFITIMLVMFSGNENTDDKLLSYNKFEELLDNGKIEKVIIENKQIANIFTIDEEKKKEEKKNKKENNSLFARPNAPDYIVEIGDLGNFEEKLDKAKKSGIPVEYQYKTQTDYIMGFLMNVLPWVIFIGFWFFMMRRMSGGAGGAGGGGVFNIGKSKAKLYDDKKKEKTTFKDVAGLEGAKEEVKEVVDFLKNTEKYTKLGGKIPKGVLLVGPPGTGKTLLAKAVAGEAKVPFFSLSGSDFVEMFVGVGASRVRDLFKKAKEKSPSIIFIDEIDAIGRARGKNNFTGGNDERESTLNQLLTEMDGFGSNDNVIVIAATNRADVLDKALLRAGRFDRQIFVDLPDLNERDEIFEVHLRPLKLGSDVDKKFLAKQTPGFSGADIANVCNEAALIAARKAKNKVEKQDFLDAVDRIIGGLEKKNKVIKPAEKNRVAHHEAGHATASWLLEHAHPLIKVTIVPRGQSLGAAWYLPEERVIIEKEQMLDEMAATLAGRAAEEVVFGNISTGALNDLEKVTKQARAMVTVYGLNKRIGNLTYYDSANQEYGFTKPYSEKTAEIIDEEISKIIEGQYQRAIEILSNNKEKLEKLAQRLLEKEVIFKEDLEEILGKRPFDTEK
jgi:cell division protease FtsH